jgi:hypothetical protein
VFAINEITDLSPNLRKSLKNVLLYLFLSYRARSEIRLGRKTRRAPDNG